MNKMVIDKKIKQFCVLSYIKTGKVPELETISTEAHRFYNKLYWNRPDIFDIIPKNKHIERLKLIEARLETFDITEYDKYISEIYENRILPLFESIENNLLYTKNKPEKSKYNLFTTTGRPSNSNGGINYAAINKDDGSRERFVSRYNDGKLVEMDFDAYHIRLIGSLINYKLPSTSVHEYFAKQFYGVENVTKEEYAQSKAMSFQVLYGGVPKELETIEYFSKTKAYIFKLWDTYNYKGYIETPIFKRRLYKANYSDMNPQKLFNYLIQAFETESNICTMEKIMKFLEGKDTKLILYTYDAFLFDVPSSELKIIKEIKNIMDYPIKIHCGKNYNDMELLGG